jgi:hypothetical protein
MNAMHVVPAQAGTQWLSCAERRWVPAFAGTTPGSQRAVAPAEAGAQVLTAAHWVPACAGTTV